MQAVVQPAHNAALVQWLSMLTLHFIERELITA